MDAKDIENLRSKKIYKGKDDAEIEQREKLLVLLSNIYKECFGLENFASRLNTNASDSRLKDLKKTQFKIFTKNIIVYVLADIISRDKITRAVDVIYESSFFMVGYKYELDKDKHKYCKYYQSGINKDNQDISNDKKGCLNKLYDSTELEDTKCYNCSVKWMFNVLLYLQNHYDDIFKYADIPREECERYKKVIDNTYKKIKQFESITRFELNNYNYVEVLDVMKNCWECINIVSGYNLLDKKLAYIKWYYVKMCNSILIKGRFLYFQNYNEHFIYEQLREAYVISSWYKKNFDKDVQCRIQTEKIISFLTGNNYSEHENISDLINQSIVILENRNIGDIVGLELKVELYNLLTYAKKYSFADKIKKNIDDFFNGKIDGFKSTDEDKEYILIYIKYCIYQLKNQASYTAINFFVEEIVEKIQIIKKIYYSSSAYIMCNMFSRILLTLNNEYMHHSPASIIIDKLFREGENYIIENPEKGIRIVDDNILESMFGCYVFSSEYLKSIR